MQETFRAFHVKELNYFETEYKEKIKNYILSQDKDFIKGVNEEEYIEFLHDKFLITPIEIIKESQNNINPRKETEFRTNQYTGLNFQVDVYYIDVEFDFNGTPDVFEIHPTYYNLSLNETSEIFIDRDRNKVGFVVEFFEQSVKAFEEVFKRKYDACFMNIDNANKDVTNLNKQLLRYITNCFNTLKEAYIKEDEFLKAINIKPLNSKTYEVPIVTKTFTPRIKETSVGKITPYLSEQIYNDVLEKVYRCGKSMERKPSMYKNKDEEELRDAFLFYLEGRYDNTTITGETFNKSGKTDILMRHVDDTNLFVAECKFWHGKKEFFNSINQLFDKYLTWRDTKTALIFFVDRKEIINVCNTIKSEIKNHPYYQEYKGDKNESSFSYVFNLPYDENASVYLEVIIFHFPKLL